VSSLRKKLGDDPASPRYIHTVRGVGFRFSAADELQR
jgi:two-component system, OmpR family, response regulator RegX3